MDAFGSGFESTEGGAAAVREGWGSCRVPLEVDG